VANVSAKRSTWTRWNLHAEAERLLRTECALTYLDATCDELITALGELSEDDITVVLARIPPQ
jgi:hypothetical protein